MARASRLSRLYASRELPPHPYVRAVRTVRMLVRGAAWRERWRSP